MLHVGTNDLDQNPDIEDPTEVALEKNAPGNLGDLIDQIITACPDATTLVAKIVGNADPRIQTRIDTFNKAVPGVVAQRANNGHHVMVADMSSIGVGYLVSDGTHPNDLGYQQMASVWYQGIKQAIAQGWVKAPIGPDPHPFIPDNAPENVGCLALRDLNVIEARQNNPDPAHYCHDLPIWQKTGRISHGVSFPF